MKKTFVIIAALVVYFVYGLFLFNGTSVTSFVKVSFPGKAVYLAEIADTPEKAQKGLMERKSIPQNQGMLFLFPYPSIIKMWMKNTYIPLDMVFLNAQGQVICLRENTKPLDETIISCPYPAQKVLELNAGQIKTKNIQLGDVLLMK
ncbi:MAG: DUF192 domain-containing protein [Alphaproteobacteria bacterium]